MSELYRCGCGSIVPHPPSEPTAIPLRPMMLTDNQLEVVERFIAGDQLRGDEWRTLRLAVWRLEHPERWWRNRGRVRRNAESTRRRQSRRG